MRYLCLIFFDANEFGSTIGRDWLPVEGGRSVEAGTTVRVRNGKLWVTEGSCTRRREQLGGFSLIEARDLNQAILVASRIPPARHGSVEVWPIRELEPM